MVSSLLLRCSSSRSCSSSSSSLVNIEKRFGEYFGNRNVTRQQQVLVIALGDISSRCFSTTATNNATDAAATPTTTSKKEKGPPTMVGNYTSLAKARLSALVVTTTGVGFFAGSAAGGAVVDPALLASCLVGTALCSSCAAGWNQIIEVDRDRAMKRTQQRPLVRYANAMEQNTTNNNAAGGGAGLLSTNHAKLVATCWGLGGIGLLHLGTDPITTVLGASNIALYSGLYTWMKPRSVYNTWVGAVVGAIPPVMGYTAAATATAASAATTTPTSVMALFFLTDPEVYYLAATLYYWQMPHFFALSFMHRADYQRGGFRMLPVVEMEEQSQSQPTFDKTANVILRNTLYLSAMPLLASYCNLIHGSDTMFLLETSVLNGYVLWKSQEFYNDRTNAKARKMFLTSLWYLPSIFVIYLLHSKLWVFDEDENKQKNPSDDRITGMLRELRTVGTQYCLHEKASETAAHATITNTKTNTTTKVGDTACPITMAKSTIEGSSSMIHDFVTKQQQEIQKIVLNGVIKNNMEDDNDNNKRK